jgi:ankyrin repeat protein
LYQHLPYGGVRTRAAVVALLLKQGGDPNYEDGQLLLLAAQQQQHQVLDELLRAGANKIDKALVLAAGSGHTDAVSLLLSTSRGPVDSTGAALLSAASAEHFGIAEMLLQWGANAAAALETAVEHDNFTAAVVIILSFPAMELAKALHQELVARAVEDESAELRNLVQQLEYVIARDTA